MSDDLNDPLLTRAKMLVEAAKQTSELLKPLESLSFRGLSQTEEIRQNKTDTSNRTFRASVFKGSTLINTHDDIRQYVGRGDQIVVDGVCCTIAMNGEWTSSCIEITTDFPGDTNFSSTLCIATANNILNSPKRKKPMVPVSSDSIKQAVEQLNNFKDMYSSKLDGYEIVKPNQSAKPPKGKPSEKKRPSVVNKTQSQTQIQSSSNDPLSSTYSEAYNYQPSSLAASSTFTPMSYNAATKLDPIVRNTAPTGYGTTAQSSSSKSNSINTYNEEEEESEYGSTYALQQQQYSETAPQSNNYNYTPQLHHTAAERESLINQKVIEFNEQRAVQVANQVDPQKLAQQRIKQRIKEEQRQKELQLAEKERLKQAEIVASAMKVNELAARTQDRVARYKESLIRKEQEERQKAELELFLKKEKEKETFSETNRNKLIAIRKESVKRLRQLQREDERREAEKHILIQTKLDQISKKFDVNSTYLPPLPSNSGANGSGGYSGNSRDKVMPNTTGVMINVDGNEYSTHTNGIASGRSRPSSASRGSSSKKQQQSLPSLPPIGDLSGGNSSALRSKSEQQAVRKGKNGTANKNNNASNSTQQPQNTDSNNINSAAAVQSKSTYSQIKPTYTRAADADEWSEDDADCGLDDDSIELSRQSSNHHHSNSNKNKYTGGKQPRSGGAGSAAPSYSRYDNDDSEYDNLSDCSDLTGEGGVRAKRLDAQGGRDASSRGSRGRNNNGSKIPAPAQKTSGNSGAAANNYNSTSKKVIPLVQISQQQQQQQQQSQLSNVSPTGSKRSQSTSNTAVWRKLKPIPILPYKPIPTNN